MGVSCSFYWHFHLKPKEVPSQKNHHPYLFQFFPDLGCQLHYQGSISHPRGKIFGVPAINKSLQTYASPCSACWTKGLGWGGRGWSCADCSPVSFYEQIHLVLSGLSSWQGQWDSSAPDLEWLAAGTGLVEVCAHFARAAHNLILVPCSTARGSARLPGSLPPLMAASEQATSKPL